MKNNPALVFTTVFAALFLSACGSIQEAKAERIRAETTMQVERFRTEQQQQEILFSQSLPEMAALKRSVLISSAVAYAVLVLGVTVAFVAAAIGAAAGRLQNSLLRSKTFELQHDRFARYPCLVTYDGRGRFTITDPNSGMVIKLDTSRQADRELAYQAGIASACILAARSGQAHLDSLPALLLESKPISLPEDKHAHKTK